MTVTGDAIVENCRACFSANGYGIKLNRKGNILICAHDSSHQYAVRNGFLEKV